VSNEGLYRDIKPKHDQIKKLLLSNYTNKQIAGMMGLNPVAINGYIKTYITPELIKDDEKKQQEIDNAITFTDFNKKEIKKGIDTNDLINLMKLRSKELLSIKIGDIIKTGDNDTQTVTHSIATNLWDAGCKMAQKAIAEETKLKSLNKDIAKEIGDLNFKQTLLDIYKDTNAMEQARLDGLKAQQKLIEKHTRHVIDTEIVG
jgi:predicted transcriptional regulator